MNASVVLQGGPMDGWVVAPDAPALRPDWYATIPIRRPGIIARLLRRPAPVAPRGLYVVEPDGRAATWRVT